MGEELVHVTLGSIQALLLGLLAWAARTLHARTLDPSEVALLRKWADRFHEIGELRDSMDRLRRRLEENGFDRAEVRRVRAFFFSDGAREAEVHTLKTAVTAANLRTSRDETERRESMQRLDARLDRIDERITEMLRRLPITTQPQGDST